MEKLFKEYKYNKNKYLAMKLMYGGKISSVNIQMSKVDEDNEIGIDIYIIKIYIDTFLFMEYSIDVYSSSDVLKFNNLCSGEHKDEFSEFVTDNIDKKYMYLGHFVTYLNHKEIHDRRNVLRGSEKEQFDNTYIINDEIVLTDVKGLPTVLLKYVLNLFLTKYGQFIFMATPMEGTKPSSASYSNFSDSPEQRHIKLVNYYRNNFGMANTLMACLGLGSFYFKNNFSATITKENTKIPLNNKHRPILYGSINDFYEIDEEIYNKVSVENIL